MAVNQRALKLLTKLFDANFTTEKEISAMTMDDILAIKDVTVTEISLINSLQKSIKTGRILTFLSGISQETEPKTEKNMMNGV